MALSELLASPVVVAPMAGGPSRPALVAGAASAGAFGFLAAGYKTVPALLGEIAAVRAAGVTAFGVNVFVPGEPALDGGALAPDALAPDALARYVASLGGEPGRPEWDDDAYDQKISALLADPPAAVSFTFGCPSPPVISAFRRSGSVVIVTVTSLEEALVAAEAGAEALCVQGVEAGAHRGTFVNDDDALARDYGLLSLLAIVGSACDLPLIAAGGLMTAAQVRAVRTVGAVAAQCGTAFLRCPESGAHPLHKAALVDPLSTATALTRAFSGRPARGIVNDFMLAHPDAPAAYPEINNATRPLRAAAAAAGDTSGMSLYAGQGFRLALDLPAAEVAAMLAGVRLG
ncbi:MAG TPA: nitronate monooxygenase [Streptosporangiaceae bacterium]|jgi:nitronate monooxygenase